MRADVLHVHGLGFPRQLEQVAGAAPILIQDHADRPPPRWVAALWRRALTHAAGIAFTAREQAEPFVEAGLLARDTPIFEVLESSTTFTPGNRGEARRHTGMHGNPCCLWLGNLDANKDPFVALGAFQSVAESLSEAHLWMCWQSGPLVEAVRERVAHSVVLQSRVHLLGALQHADVQWALRAADFLLQASHREGSGYAVIEALACGTTPIVTDIPSFRRITGGGAVGALFSAGDVHGMARALLRLAAQDQAALRTQATRHFEVNLTFDAVGRELRAAYTRVAAS
jgi:hypothetical protein